MKRFTIKEDKAFRLRVMMWQCTSPLNLNAVQFISECKDKDGKVDFSSTYEFFMTNEDLKKLAEELVSE